MSWAHPFVLALVPLTLVGVWWTFRRPGGGTGVELFKNIKRLWASRRGLSDSPSATRRRARGVLLAIGALCAVVALARPQWGTIEEETYDQSREVLLALDLSRSMLADDVSPTRLDRAKLLIESLLDQLSGERVGLVLFAGTSFLQSPLSADYEVLRDFLPDLEPSYLPQGGTDYRAMLTAATKSFGQTGDGDRFLVVLSDGEAHDDQWKNMISTLQRRGIQVISLGVGTADGAVVPDGKGGVVKDEEGAVVLSRLDPSTLQELATETGGTYRDAEAWVDIPELLNATVEQGRQGRYVEERHVRLQDQYQWFLAPAVLFFLLSYWIEFPVYAIARVLRQRRSLKRTAPAGAVAAALLLVVFCSAPRDAAAAPGPEPGSEPNVVEKTVGELVARPQLVADDYAELAQHTIDFASQPEAIEGEPRLGVIDDALVGVDLGESLDSEAADWPTLREQLEQLKQTKEEPPPPEQQQDPPPEQDQQCDGGGGQDQQQSQGGGGGGSSQDESQDESNEQNQGGSSGDQQQESQGGESDQDNAENQQSADGEPNSESEDQNESDSPANDSGDSEQNSGQEGQEQAEADGNQGGQAGAQNGNDAQANPQPAGEQPRQEQASGGEVEREDVSPLEAAEAGFGELEAMDQPETATAAAASGDEPAEAQPDTRLVGGGGALEGGVPEDNVALAVAAGTMERIKDADSPSVLFDRMNRAEKPEPPEKSGKNW